MKHKGVSYSFTGKELSYLLFKKKKCRNCNHKLVKIKKYETKLGKDLNSKSDPIFISNANVKSYYYIFKCENCGKEYTLEELANKN